MMASTLTCFDSSDDTIFSKFCDINPSSSETHYGERFCEFKIPISWFDPPLGCVYIIYQDTNEVYVGKTYHLGDRFHKYANSWDWDSTDIRTDHAANINKKILAGAEAGHCFEIWISPIKDESERVVVEKDTIHRTQPDWNNIMYEGKKRELGFDFNDQVYYEWAKDRMPFFDIFSDDYFRSGAQAYPPPVSPPYFSTASTGFDQDEEYPKRRSKEEVHPPDPPRICPKCGYHVPADSNLILCPCGKWVI